ncbi:hypothetical protein ACE1ET_09605 [Saccharicrinis sp. FJH62]|uniref:hypothetical protein n=1 Tax=Saccharicrinis sp. FJH62 TaxID=3344657 RepID=UPI0035D46C31
MAVRKCLIPLIISPVPGFTLRHILLVTIMTSPWDSAQFTDELVQNNETRRVDIIVTCNYVVSFVNPERMTELTSASFQPFPIQSTHGFYRCDHNGHIAHRTEVALATGAGKAVRANYRQIFLVKGIAALCACYFFFNLVHLFAVSKSG